LQYPDNQFSMLIHSRDEAKKHSDQLAYKLQASALPLHFLAHLSVSSQLERFD